jgi:DNA-directed RNA polymerase specialized sigma54-like protein
MRVNARFEGVSEQQVDYLVKSMGVSVSEVLRLSVDSYYRQARGQAPALRHFARHVGAHASGRSDTSARSKELVRQAIDAKHGRRA